MGAAAIAGHSPTHLPLDPANPYSAASPTVIA